MNEAARDAESRRPGVRHHEAAHAVFASHAKQPIEYVTVGDYAAREDPESVSLIRYMRGDPVGTAIVVAGILAGKYAEELAATGRPREHVPYERFSEGIEEAWRTNTWTAGTEMDEVQVFLSLVPLGRQNMEGVYGAACVFAAEHVELWWEEIDALAARLLEVGRVDGAEVARIVEASRESNDESG